MSCNPFPIFRLSFTLLNERKKSLSHNLLECDVMAVDNEAQWQQTCQKKSRKKSGEEKRKKLNEKHWWQGITWFTRSRNSWARFFSSLFLTRSSADLFLLHPRSFALSHVPLLSLPIMTERVSVHLHTVFMLKATSRLTFTIQMPQCRHLMSDWREWVYLH